MINANELRIGNYVAYNEGIIRVDSILPHHFDSESKLVGMIESKTPFEYIGRWLERLDPIPLTPEWLERCGFCLDNKLIRLHEEEVHYSYRNHNLELTFTVAYVKDLTGADITRIRIRIDGDILFVPKVIVYVHQLQNLYFALTGDELTIK